MVHRSRLATLTLIGFTIVALLVGLSLLLLANTIEMERVYKEILTALGVTLISASTIGLLTEIFLQELVIKKSTEIEGKFLESLIPKIIDSVYDWVNNKSKKIPIDKSTLYNLLKIGYHQWFMKENFNTIGIPSQRVSDLYQKSQLQEFKEPTCVDFVVTLTNLGISTIKTAKRNLIDVQSKLEFFAVNTSNEDHDEVRYINTNGIVTDFYVDVFELLPQNSTEKNDFLNRMNLELKSAIIDDMEKVNMIPIEVDYAKYLRSIKEKDEPEISKIVEELGHKIDRTGKTAYILYHFFTKPSPEIPGFYYVVFYPYAIKSQQRIKISYSRTHSYAENDYYYSHLHSLTKGLVIQLEKFENTHDTAIVDFLLHDEPIAKRTHNLLITSSLLLPRSSFILSWQKK